MNAPLCSLLCFRQEQCHVAETVHMVHYVSGKNNIVWPGLNAPVLKGREVVSIKQLPPDPERETKIREARDRGSQFRTFKVPALQRGWTGAKFAGTSIGPPDPVGECKLLSAN